MTATVDSPVLTKVLSIDHTFFVFTIYFVLLLLIIAIMEVYLERLKKRLFSLLFTIIYPKINILLRQSCINNNLPMHIRENTNFPL